MQVLEERKIPFVLAKSKVGVNTDKEVMNILLGDPKVQRLSCIVEGGRESYSGTVQTSGSAVIKY